MRTMPALVLIDVQQGFNDPYWGTRNNPNFEENASALLDQWRKLDLPVFHIQHLSSNTDSPLRPDRKGVEFMTFARPRPGESVITKNVNSAFIGTDLEILLRRIQVRDLVLAGLTTDHCVSSSARMGKNLGFQILIAHDATATFNRKFHDGAHFDADFVHNVSLASLNHEFATLQTTQQILESDSQNLFAIK